MSLCVRLQTSRTRRIIRRVHASSPWAMLSRQMSTPARISFSSIASSSVAGPRVKMILVSRNDDLGVRSGGVEFTPGD